MADITVQSIVRAGLLPGTPDSAAGGGDAFLNTGREFIEIANGSGSSINVTIATQSTVDGLAVADRVVAVGAGETKKIGPFPKGAYNDSDGKVQVTYSAAGSVTIAVFNLDI